MGLHRKLRAALLLHWRELAPRRSRMRCREANRLTHPPACGRVHRRPIPSFGDREVDFLAPGAGGGLDGQRIPDGTRGRRIIQRGSYQDLTESPAEDFVREFVQAQRGIHAETADA